RGLHLRCRKHDGLRLVRFLDRTVWRHLSTRGFVYHRHDGLCGVRTAAGRSQQTKKQSDKNTHEPALHSDLVLVRTDDEREDQRAECGRKKEERFHRRINNSTRLGQMTPRQIQSADEREINRDKENNRPDQERDWMERARCHCSAPPCVCFFLPPLPIVLINRSPCGWFDSAFADTASAFAASVQSSVIPSALGCAVLAFGSPGVGAPRALSTACAAPSKSTTSFESLLAPWARTEVVG